MKAHRMITAIATTAAGIAISLGTATTASAAPQTASVSSPAATTTINVTFNLLAPNAPVTFTVNGGVVGTGTTDSVGNVSFSYTPQGLAPGYYRLVATTNVPGLSSSIGFGVQ
jgi:hypothetical protein